jgi:hypothetical protein
MEKYCDALKSLGMQPTSADKKGLPVLAPIKTLQFLKRKFVTTHEGKIIAPIDRAVFQDLVHWTRSGDRLELQQRIGESLLESALHSPETFERWKQALYSSLVVSQEWSYLPQRITDLFAATQATLRITLRDRANEYFMSPSPFSTDLGCL